MDANDKTIPNHSMPPVSSGTHGQGDQLLQSGMMLPPQSPGILGVIGKYQVIKILGEGGMGQVVLAREPVTDSMVAIKLIKPEYIHKEWAVHRFLTEARHMFRMSHPSIIRVLDVSDRPEGPYFVMPFMSGGSLAGKIKPGEHLTGETILPVARAVAEALHHAHGRGITHRDLKPANILLDGEGRAHLADFGLLRTFFNDSVVDTSQPQIEGTVPYMSPAVAAGKAEDTRCDIYAFGCLLYEMLTSQPPYQGPTVDAMLRQIQDGPPPPIRQINPHAHAALTTIAEHAMARELRDRYASMADVVAELERVAQGKEPIGKHGKVAAKPKNKKALIAAGIVALVGLAAYGVSRIPKASQPPPHVEQPAPNLPNNGSATPAPLVEGAFSYTVKDGAVTIVKYTGPGAVVTIPSTINGLPVTSLGDSAFAACTNITDVTIPEGVTSIGSAFANCTSLTNIVIPRSVERIATNLGGWAFSGCTGLISIEVDAANPFYSSVDGLLFNKEKTWLIGCPAGKAGDYVIPASVTRIKQNAFRECTKLISVTIPSAVKNIEYRAFRKCYALTEVYFEGDAPTLGIDVFSFVHAPVYYRPTAKGWGKDFGGRPTAVWAPVKDAKPPLPQTSSTTPEPLVEGDFSYTVKDSAVTIVKYTGPGGEVKIPEKIKGLPVTEIGQKAFLACVKMIRVELPAGLIRLGDSAFGSCSGLTHVEIPSTVTDIGNFAFDRCYALASITIPNSVTRIGDYAFSSCTSLPTVTIPESVTSIGARAFNVCSGLLNITIPNKVASIGGNAFLGCIKLTRVTIPASVTTIGPGPFTGCSALVEITVDEANPVYCSVDGVLFEKKNSIPLQCPQGKAGTYKIPDGVTKIGPGAFTNCTKLTGVTIPNSVTEIGTNAFAGCTSLSSINIPASVSSIVGVPFSGCSALTAIMVDAANPFYSSEDGVLFNKQKTVLILCPGSKAGHYEIPGSVTTISPAAFADCLNLTGITIPNSVSEIGGGAFSRCTGLMSMAIPASVHQIGADAFLACAKLMAIKVDSANPAYSSSEDGVLFSKDKAKLVRCPPGKTGSYGVPNGVTSIERLAFGDCANLTDITLPDSVSQICAYAFSGCARLNRIEIGKGLQGIGQRAFYPCVGLAYVILSGNIPNGDVHPEIFYSSRTITVCHLPESKGWGKEFAGRPTALWDAKLRYCYTIDKDAVTLIKYLGQGGDVTIPDKIGGFPVVGIAESAFQNCTTLTSLTVPTGVTGIIGRAFDGCSGLAKVTLPAGVTSMGASPMGQLNPFVNCPKLVSITVDAANPTFRSNAEGILFNKEMTSLLAYPRGRPGTCTIPDGVTSVGLAAFEGCDGLTEVKIPRSVTALGPYPKGASNPFQNCPKLTSIAVDQMNATYSSTADGVVFSKDKTVLGCYPSGKTGSYDVPDGVTRIGEGAFAFCAGLTTVTMPASLTAINGAAFMNSGAASAVFFKGNAPTSVIFNAFQGADKATIYYLPTTTGWGKEFGGRPTAVWDGKAR